MDFGEAFGEGLIGLSDMMIKDSFEDRAYKRKKEVEQAMWEERNAVTNPQAIALKEMDVDSRKESAKLLADAKLEAARVLAEGKKSAAKTRAKSKLTQIDRKADTAKKELNAVPVTVDLDAERGKSEIKSLTKMKELAAKDGEDTSKIDQKLVRARKHYEVYAQAQRLYATGQPEEAARIVGEYQQGLYEEQKNLRTVRTKN